MNVDTELKHLHKQIRKHAPSLEAEDFKQISKHGIDGGFNGFIYYSDTIKFFDRNEELITDFLNEEADNLGVDGMFKLFNKDYQCYSIDEFKNWASWYIAETVAHEIANNSRLSPFLMFLIPFLSSLLFLPS